MTTELSDYSPLPEAHPWRKLDDDRRIAVSRWMNGNRDEAYATLLRIIQEAPDFPYGWSTYHRLLHAAQGTSGRPAEGMVLIEQSQFFVPFRLYKYFGLCSSAQMVAAKGWNGFEPPCPLILAKWLSHVRGTFCDVGANSGYYALLALASGVSRAIAFEPFAPAAELLRSNLELNGWGDRGEVVQHAVADSEGFVSLYVPTRSNGWLATGASQDATFCPPHSLECRVPVGTLDAWLSGDNYPAPLTIKIDVEGSGPTVAAMSGARRIMATKRPVMMVEHFQGVSYFLGGVAQKYQEAGDALDRMLAEHSYRSYVCNPDGTCFHEPKVTPQQHQLNHFFVPAEESQQFLARICETI